MDRPTQYMLHTGSQFPSWNLWRKNSTGWKLRASERDRAHGGVSTDSASSQEVRTGLYMCRLQEVEQSCQEIKGLSYPPQRRSQPSRMTQQFFFSWDAAAGFWQIPLDNDWQPLLLHSQGTVRLQFGIYSSPGNFQRKMMEILEGLEEVDVYMDNIIVQERDFFPMRNVLSVQDGIVTRGNRMVIPNSQFPVPNRVEMKS